MLIMEIGQVTMPIWMGLKPHLIRFIRRPYINFITNALWGSCSSEDRVFTRVHVCKRFNPQLLQGMNLCLNLCFLISKDMHVR